MYETVSAELTQFGLRVETGNNPIRVEGYKVTAFELWEQLGGKIPDFIAVPTSATGHVRGIFKGFRELLEAGYIKQLPKIIIVQAKNANPIVNAIKSGKNTIILVSHPQTVAGAIKSEKPLGGNGIIALARKYDWLAEDVTEEEIIESQVKLAQAGYFVEPSSATTLAAVKKLREAGKI